jgi:hypothetical protein
LTKVAAIAVLRSLLRRVSGVAESALFVLDSLAGKVKQEQIVTLAVAEKVFDVLTYLVRRFVQQRLHLKAADGRFFQDHRQSLGILRWRDQLAQACVPVLVAGDDQRDSPLSHL